MWKGNLLFQIQEFQNQIAKIKRVIYCVCTFKFIKSLEENNLLRNELFGERRQKKITFDVDGIAGRSTENNTSGI